MNGLDRRAVLSSRCFCESCKCMGAPHCDKGRVFSLFFFVARYPKLGHWFARNVIRSTVTNEWTEWLKRKANIKRVKIKNIHKREKEKVEDWARETQSEEGRKNMTMGRVGAGELEDWRLLNQQKPLGGWFSDANTTSATESFPSYLFSLFESL